MSRIVSTIVPATPALAVTAGTAGIFACIATSLPVLVLAAPGAVAGWGVYSLYRHLYHSNV
jgi:hypothetical protein